MRPRTIITPDQLPTEVIAQVNEIPPPDEEKAKRVPVGVLTSAQQRGTQAIIGWTFEHTRYHRNIPVDESSRYDGSIHRAVLANGVDGPLVIRGKWFELFNHQYMTMEYYTTERALYDYLGLVTTVNQVCASALADHIRTTRGTAQSLIVQSGIEML